MGETSIQRALDEAFGLIRRHPGAVAVWALLYLLLGVLPQYGLMALSGPVFQNLASAGASPATTSATVLQRMQLIGSVQGLTLLFSLVCQTLQLGAAYRAVLFPEEGGFFFLRLGVRELWLGLVMLVLLIGFFVMLFVVALPLAVIGGIVGVAGGAGAAVAVIPIMMLVALGFVVWVALRLSLAPPMSFAERGFKLFESWRLTRGHAARLLAIAAVFVVMLIVAEAVVGLGGFLLMGGPARLGQLAEAARNPQVMFSLMGPMIVGFSVILTALSAVFYALVGGAWAQIYRDLNPKPEDVFA
jgi:hypothetical protein